jgi:hypothetical protein
MTNRREVMSGAFAALWQAAAYAQNQAGPAPVFKHELPDVNLDNWEVTVSIVDYAPGRVGQAHRHAGFVLAYVLQGTVITKISGQPETAFTRPARCSTRRPAALTKFRKAGAPASPPNC